MRSGSSRQAAERRGGAAASGADPLEGGVSPGADRRSAGGVGVNAVGVDTDCVEYEGDAETVRSKETCMVVGRNANAGACTHYVF